MSVAIVTDSVADVPRALAEDLGIQVVPYNVHWGSSDFKDGVDLLPKAFYERLATDPVMPKTSCPSAGEYGELYRSLAGGHDGIVSLHITAKGSGAYQSACMGRAMVPEADITPVDTCAASMATGYIAIEAARAARQGANKEEVLSVVAKLKGSIFQVYTADTLRFLFLGGRIGRAKHMLGSLLNLKPLVTMDRDGVISPVGQAMSRNGALRRVVELIEQWAGREVPLKLALVQGAAEADLARLKEMITAEFTCLETLEAEFGPALGVHTGPGTVGAVFFRAGDI